MMKIKAFLSLLSLLFPNGHTFATAAKSDSPPVVKMIQQVDNEAAVAAASAAGRTYSLRIDAALPLTLRNGEPEIDRCVEWMGDANGSNFTWYGLRIQLPGDAATQSGQYYPDATRATRELGFVKKYNSTTLLLESNFTTKESQPAVRVNFNDEPFWDTYNFDFVERGSVVADSASYQEFEKTMRGSISCFTAPARESTRRILLPVIPTLTISLTTGACVDSPAWKSTSSRGHVRDCAWVAQWPDMRCAKMSDEGVPATVGCCCDYRRK